MILGLTGGYCSGKSSAAEVLKGTGWVLVDVDAMGHAALKACARSVAELLGPSALKPDGSPDRRAIGAMVFSEQSLLARYEAIVHPAMNKLVESAILEHGFPVHQHQRSDASSCPGICVDAALLYRLPVVDRCDAIIEVRAPLLARIRRGRLRDGLGPAAVLERIARQRSLWVAGRAFYDRIVIVKNSGSKTALEAAILAVEAKLLSYAGLN